MRLRIFFCIRSSEWSASARIPRGHQPVDHTLHMITERIGDRDANDLHRRQPGRERTCVMLGEQRGEASTEPNSARFIMTGRCLLPSDAVYSSSNRSAVEMTWIVDIRWQRVPRLHGDWPVEGGPPGSATNSRPDSRPPPPGPRHHRPDVVGTTTCPRCGSTAPGRVVQAVVGQQVRHESRRRPVVAHCPGCRRCAHRPASSPAPGSDRDHAGLLVAVDGADSNIRSGSSRSDRPRAQKSGRRSASSSA